jgi:hypothetical protein
MMGCELEFGGLSLSHLDFQQGGTPLHMKLLKEHGKEELKPMV